VELESVALMQPVIRLSDLPRELGRATQRVAPVDLEEVDSVDARQWHDGSH